MATVGFLPGLLRMTDCANSGAQVSASAKASGLVILVLRLLLLFLLCGFIRLFLQAIGLLLRQILAQLQIALAIEVDLPFDEGRVDTRIRRERMAVPDGQIGVLADIDRPD